MSTPFEMIGTVEDLHRAVERMSGESAVALDTEFVWEKTYYAQLGLVQAALADGTCFLFDAVALPDLAPLGEILAAPRIVKILHDAPQDLMILRRATGAVAQNIFDTRLAAGFAGALDGSGAKTSAATSGPVDMRPYACEGEPVPAALADFGVPVPLPPPRPAP